MKTQVIIKKGWRIIAEFDHLIQISKNDIVIDKDGIEYRVDCALLDLYDNVLKILIQ